VFATPLRTRQRRSMASAMVIMMVWIYCNFDAFSRPQSAANQAD
jgi:hypothetical protein